jgi:hypothetical protein
MGYFMRSLHTFSLALIIMLVLGTHRIALIASADSPEGADLSHALECAAGHPLQITLPQTFERMPSDNPAVLCIFRNKIDGFPTLNIVIEPRIEGSTPPTLAEYEEGIRRGYQSVGLTDAQLSGTSVGESNGVPFFTSEVFFTNNNRSMAAHILVIQLHDRTYTASAVGYAVPNNSELQGLIGTIHVEGKTIDLTARPPVRWAPVAGGILLALTIGALYWWSTKRGEPSK